MKAKTGFISLRIGAELLKRLDEHADIARRSRGDFIRLILEMYLDAIEKPEEKPETRPHIQTTEGRYFRTSPQGRKQVERNKQ